LDILLRWRIIVYSLQVRDVAAQVLLDGISRMTVAAAAMLVSSDVTAQQGVAILEQALKSAASGTDKVNIELALLDGLTNLSNYDRLLSISSELAALNPGSKRAFRAQFLAFRGLGRLKEANELANERLKRFPDDLDTIRALAVNAEDRGDYRSASDLLQKLAMSGKAESSDLNQIAWLSLFFPRTGGPDIETAIKASQSRQNDSSILHTLGCLYIEAGQTKEAREVFVRAMDLLNLDEPNGDFWYAFGRLAEQFGETAVARTDYQKVPKPKSVLKIPGSTYQLAQNRLSALSANKLN
jgi:tetratricopeptide (TPR) repeat protein